MAIFNISLAKFGNRGEEEFETLLKEQVRANVQFLTNSIFSLPRLKDEEGLTYVELPMKEMDLPRSKPLPSMTAGNEPRTKWEKFAASKGIKKKTKSSSHVFNEELDKYVPKHGPKSAKNLPMANWCEEIDD